MKKRNITERLERLKHALGGWDAVALEFGLSRTQLFRLRSDHSKIAEKHLVLLDAIERKAGITKSSTEVLLRQMLVDRMALIYAEAGGDPVRFEKLTGLPFDISVLAPEMPLPPCNELRRIAGLASKKMASCLEEAQAAMDEIEAAKITISEAQDKLRNLIYYTRERSQSGLLEEDPLLKVIDAYESEKPS